MSKPKPVWWPTNPYPVEIFPMALSEYPKIVPNDKTRTALSGMLGREFWEIASNKIWEAWCDYLEDYPCDPACRCSGCMGEIQRQIDSF